MSQVRSKLVTAALALAAVGGGAVAANAATNAATAPSSSSQSTAGQSAPAAQGRHSANGKTEQALSGDVAAKVRAAALAKVSGTVERVETNVDSSAPYEAHIHKADGTDVVVEVNQDYSVAAVKAMGAHP